MVSIHCNAKQLPQLAARSTRSTPRVDSLIFLSQIAQGSRLVVASCRSEAPAAPAKHLRSHLRSKLRSKLRNQLGSHLRNHLGRSAKAATGGVQQLQDAPVSPSRENDRITLYCAGHGKHGPQNHTPPDENAELQLLPPMGRTWCISVYIISTHVNYFSISGTKTRYPKMTSSSPDCA